MTLASTNRGKPGLSLYLSSRPRSPIYSYCEPITLRLIVKKSSNAVTIDCNMLAHLSPSKNQEKLMLWQIFGSSDSSCNTETLMSMIAGTIRSSLGVVRIRGAKLHFNVLSYGTLVKQQATTFQIVPQIRDYLKKAKWQLGSKFPLSYSKIILKARAEL